MRAIEELSGFRTTDGRIFPDRIEARKHQANLDLIELIGESSEPPYGAAEDTLFEFLANHYHLIADLFYTRETGFPPDD